MQFGLIGFPLAHSFSKKYFEEKFLREQIQNVAYDLFPLQYIEELPILIEQQKPAGLNVTIPHKESVLQFCTHLSDEVKAVGATNCLKIIGKEIHAFNTDIFGFENSLKPLLKSHHRQALILGTGGSSKAVQFVLNRLSIKFTLVSRKQIKNAYTYSQLSDEIIQKNSLIINASPLGMFPNTGASPDIPYRAITSKHLVMDLVYNPAMTTFLNRAAAQGASIKNGLEMLHLQAEKSWQIWNS